MRTKLNPDGAKIRTLRIQRGWTQEQLAEIAGVSTRTIQRAEAADSAAFETVRALADAFGADFSQLLKAGTREILNPAPEPDACPESGGPVVADPAGQPGRSAWGTFQVALATLAMGLLAGVALTSWLGRPSVTDPAATRSAAASSSAGSPTSGTGQETGLYGAGALRAALATRAILRPETGSGKGTRHAVPAARTPGRRSSAARAPEIFGPADVALKTVVSLSPESEDFYLPLEARDPILTIPVLQVPVEWSAPSFSSDGLSQGPQGSGAVRQAMGDAGKKTGAFFVKVAASIKRVF
jgi:transcriptional regulator with XRE-family HTH domain